MAETLLSKVADLSVLQDAWRQVRSNGLSSKSQTSQQAVKEFDASVESHLKLISEHLSSGNFEFGPARGVLIPRTGKDPRPLVIASIPARIVQRALLDILQGLEEVGSLATSRTSFGGTPGGSVQRAVRAACEAISAGSSYYIRSDIEAFFTKIPRPRVMKLLGDVLPDDSIMALLDGATSLEIENLSELGKYEALMPSEFEGIAQGCCLSPLFGNLLLHEFDKEMNGGGVTTLRYIDDFLILGPDDRSVQKAFRRGNAILKRSGLSAYPPGDRSGKAASGQTRKGMQFLGCWITHKVIEPSPSARAAFASRVETELRYGVTHLHQAVDGDYSRSVASTLRKISRMIEGWTKQYSFCNPTDVFDSVDRKIDRYIQTYMNSFFSIYRKNKTSMKARRRLLGVWLTSDADRSPILPLEDPDGT